MTAISDTRSHRSLLDDDKLEYITDIPGDAIPLVVPLMGEAGEFFDEDLEEFIRRFLRLHTAKGGKRADLTARVAMRDDELRDTPEGRVQRPKV